MGRGTLSTPSLYEEATRLSIMHSLAFTGVSSEVAYLLLAVAWWAVSAPTFQHPSPPFSTHCLCASMLRWSEMGTKGIFASEHVCSWPNHDSLHLLHDALNSARITVAFHIQKCRHHRRGEQYFPQTTGQRQAMLLHPPTACGRWGDFAQRLCQRQNSARVTAETMTNEQI